MTDAPREIFRREALAQVSGRTHGETLKLTPAWTRRVYPVLVLALLCAALYSVFGTLHEYAAGPAVIWISGQTHVTATVSGMVSAIEVAPGQRVEAGQLLVRFASAVEMAELSRIDREFELELAKTLRDPKDDAARRALTALHTQRDVAAARLELLSIRAPKAGIIGDVRIRSGQHLEAGDVIVTLVGEDRRCSVLAMLPAHYRPQLRPGMHVRFEISGYRYAYQEMELAQVSAQIIGPAEVRRFLGQEIEDTLKVEGPVVLVEAIPSSPTFTVDGQSFDFYHGMSGMLEARVRTESIAVSLVPGLRALLGRTP